MFSFTIRGINYAARTLAGASFLYCHARDESGEGASTFPFAALSVDGIEFAHISYNGRIWHGKAAGRRYESGTTLYDPAADPVPALLATAKALLEHIAAMQEDEDFDACTCDAGGILFGDVMGDDIAAIRTAIAKAETALT